MTALPFFAILAAVVLASLAFALAAGRWIAGCAARDEAVEPEFMGWVE